MESITGTNYKHAKRVWEDFLLQNVGQYDDLYLGSNTLLLADVFETFRNKCLEIYELDPAYFVSAPAFAWQICLKKKKLNWNY